MMSTNLRLLTANVTFHTFSAACPHFLPSSSRAERLRNLKFAVALVACVLLSACSKHSTLSDDVQGLTLKTLTGKQIALADSTGPLLINFWATDCAVCISEMPEIAELYENYKPAGFELIAVAMPYDPPNRVLEMTEREQWPFPVALDISGEAVSSFATVVGTPTSYLLDKNGKLVKRYVGAIPIDKLKKQLDSLLGIS